MADTEIPPPLPKWAEQLSREELSQYVWNRTWDCDRCCNYETTGLGFGSTLFCPDCRHRLGSCCKVHWILRKKLVYPPPHTFPLAEAGGKVEGERTVSKRPTNFYNTTEDNSQPDGSNADADWEAYQRGSMSETSTTEPESLKHHVRVFDKNGKGVQVLALVDTGSIHNFIFSKAITELKKELHITCLKLPLVHIHKYSSPMMGTVFQPDQYVRLAVEGDAINGFRVGGIIFRILPSESLNPDLKIILGRKFIRRHLKYLTTANVDGLDSAASELLVLQRENILEKGIESTPVKEYIDGSASSSTTRDLENHRQPHGAIVDTGVDLQDSKTVSSPYSDISLTRETSGPTGQYNDHLSVFSDSGLGHHHGPVSLTLDTFSEPAIQDNASLHDFLTLADGILPDFVTQEESQRLGGGDNENLSISSSSDLFTTTAPSTAPSIGGDLTTEEDQFVDLLFEDQGFKLLFSEIFPKLPPDRFERNLERLLKRFSVSLRQESRKEIEVGASKFIRKRARRLANEIRNKLDPNTLARQRDLKGFLDGQSKKPPSIEDYLLQAQTFAEEEKKAEESGKEPDHSESEEENDADRDQPPRLDLAHLRAFIQNSEGLETFRKELIDFAIPLWIPLRKDFARQDLTKFKSNQPNPNTNMKLPNLDLISLIIFSCQYLKTECDLLSFAGLAGELDMLEDTLKVCIKTPDSQGKWLELISEITIELKEIQHNVAGETTKMFRNRYRRQQGMHKPLAEIKAVIFQDDKDLGVAPNLLPSIRSPNSTESDLRGDINPAVVKIQENLASLILQLRKLIPSEDEEKEISHTAELIATIGSTPHEPKPSIEDLLIPRTSTPVIILIKAFLGIETVWKRLTRPSVKEGYKRIEWICECGEELYGDFDNSNPKALEALVQELHSHTTAAKGSAATGSTAAGASGKAATTSTGVASSSQGIELTPLSPQNTQSSDNHSDTDDSIKTESSKSTVPDDPNATPKFLAICVNTGTTKTLAEIDVTAVITDEQLFKLIRKAYRKARGWRLKFHFLMKPTKVQYVRFTLWTTYEGYVGIKRTLEQFPNSPREDYDFPLLLPQMPLESFIHYLDGGTTRSFHVKNMWIPRLPKRLGAKIICREPPIEGWGIYIVEGPNKTAVFWIIIVTVFLMLLAAILFSVFKKDIQGGTGMGAMMLAAPPIIMAAFLFRLGSV